MLGMVEPQVGLTQAPEVIEGATEFGEGRLRWVLLEELSFRR